MLRKIAHETIAPLSEYDIGPSSALAFECHGVRLFACVLNVLDPLRNGEVAPAHITVDDLPGLAHLLGLFDEMLSGLALLTYAYDFVRVFDFDLIVYLLLLLALLSSLRHELLLPTPVDRGGKGRSLRQHHCLQGASAFSC